MRQAFCEKVRGIAHIFRKQADRDYLTCICDMHTNSADVSQGYRELMDFSVTLDEQYFDHINKQAIKTIIDGGMENGGTTIRFLHHFPGCTVHAFEPLPAAVKLSPFYPYIQGCEQIRLVFKGLSDTVSSGMLNINPDCFGENAIIESSACEYSERIETTTIDDYAAAARIAKIDFIKLDIESFEIKALHGAKQTIAKDRPQMAICIYHKPEHYYEIPLLLSEMCTDYNFYLGFYGVGNFLESVMYCIPREIDPNA